MKGSELDAVSTQRRLTSACGDKSRRAIIGERGWLSQIRESEFLKKVEKVEKAEALKSKLEKANEAKKTFAANNRESERAKNSLMEEIEAKDKLIEAHLKTIEKLSLMVNESYIASNHLMIETQEFRNSPDNMSKVTYQWKATPKDVREIRGITQHYLGCVENPRPLV